MRFFRESKLFKILLAMVFPVLIFLLYKNTSSYLGDTDRYYHFALSKILVEKGGVSLNELPQAQNVGWGSYFPDKEFLFHVVTKFSYALGGDSGVVISCLAIAAALGVLLYVFGLGFLPPYLALLCAFAAFFTHSLIFRLLLVRPHVLAIFLFILLNVALLKRRPYLTAMSAAAFVLAYHAFYIPLICFGLVFLVSTGEAANERKLNLRLLGFGAAGLLLGLVANPYFPSQLFLGLQHAQIPFLLSGGLKNANFGMELFPLGGPALLKFYYFPFLVLLLGIWVYRPSFTHRYLLALTLLFGVLTFQTSRAGEYFIPLAGMLLAVSAGRLIELGNRLVAPGLVALSVFQLFFLAHIARTEASFVPDAEMYEKLREAVKAIPPGGAKVFNCEWDTAPTLLYFRADLQFVDLLDPTFLFRANPKLHAERRALLEGKRMDPFRLMAKDFESSFVLCRNLAVVAQLAADPSFQQIYPISGTSPVYLFRRAYAPSAAFVKSFDVAAFVSDSAQSARRYDPAKGAEFQRVELPEGVLALEQHDLSNAVVTCRIARPSPEEIQRHSGANYLGLGGGQAIRAWRNGKLLYASGPAFTRARIVQALVPLSPPLAGGEKLEILACSSGQAAYVGISASLWTARTVKEVCAWKKEFLNSEGVRTDLEIFTSHRESCIGTMAAPTVPAGLEF